MTKQPLNKEQEKKVKDPIRKEGRKKGERTQKMVSFRIDNDLIDWLNKQRNKGRYINNLIRHDMVESWV